MPLLHRLSFGVADLRRSAAFHDAALGALGFVRVWSDLEGAAADRAVGYGREGGGEKFAIKQRTGSPIVRPAGLHLAFPAADRDVPCTASTRPRPTAAATTACRGRARTTAGTTTRPS